LSLRVIDHKDHNRTNNTLNNLRWVTHTTNVCNKTIVKGVAQHFVDNLPEGCKPFTSYQVHPEKEMEDGTMQPAEVRKLPNLFAKWICTTDEKGVENWTVENFYSYDSLNQYRILNPCKKAPKSVHYRDENRKVTSIAASKVQQPDDQPAEEAPKEEPKEEAGNVEEAPTAITQYLLMESPNMNVDEKIAAIPSSGGGSWTPDPDSLMEKLNNATKTQSGSSSYNHNVTLNTGYSDYCIKLKQDSYTFSIYQDGITIINSSNDHRIDLYGHNGHQPR
jgi:hypothetical protein